MAYALIVSLKQTLEPLLGSVGSKIQIPNSELNLIYNDLCYLKSFFNKIISLEHSISVEELEKQIKDVVQKAQDLIESHLSDLVHAGDKSSVSGFSRELGEVKDRLGSLIEMVKAKEDWLTGDQQSLAADVAVSSEIDFGRNNIIVGLQAELLQLLYRLLEGHFSRQVICLAGMAGIGKTALAKEVYLNQLTNEHFDIRLFVEIGVEFELKDLLLRLLYQRVFGQTKDLLLRLLDQRVSEQMKDLLLRLLGPWVSEQMKDLLLRLLDQRVTEQMKDLLLRLLDQRFSEQTKELTVDELGDQLRKYLYGRRYLVVLDDIWDTLAWAEIRRFFPDNSNGSRIILTTTITHVARCACREENILQKRFLNDDESWDLLYKMAFSETEKCPSELEEIGKTIARKLGGLPLAIVDIGKLLSISPPTVESWRGVAQNIKSRMQETAIPKILNASYAQLPQRLKACFLYLGLFQPNYNIPTSQLFRLWVAEGFVQPVPVKSLEEIAEEYLEDLVSRSLVIINDQSSTGRIKTCKMHQVLQDLCVIEARQQKLVHLVNGGTTSSRDGTRNQRRLNIQSDVVVGVMEPASSVRSVVFMCPQQQYPSPVFVRCRWLRVFHALSIRFCKFPDEILKLVRLRYLAITYDGEELPSSISRLRNLEVLIICPSQTIKSSVLLPLEIWKLHKLRHLQCMGFDLPDPSMGDGRDFLVLRKLLSLSGVSARSCIEGVLARMPNLIKLALWSHPPHHAFDISCLNVLSNLLQLKSLKCVITNSGLVSRAAYSFISFPSSLRKLTLCGHAFVLDERTPILAHLPELQILKLQCSTFRGLKWELYEQEKFGSLEVLVLEDLDIEQFIVESYHFPRLRRLLIRHCHRLREIPLQFVDIRTLQLIEVTNCNLSVIRSAKRLQEVQEELGNDDLRVRICSSVDGNHSLVEDEGSDEVRTWFPCPFCYVEIELPMLCLHLQEDHRFALKNADCPICAANLGRDAIGHFAAQHAHSIKRRKKSQKSGFLSNASSNIIRDLREWSSFLGSNSPIGKEASLDPLAPFLCTVPLTVSKDSQEDKSCVAATSDAERTSRLDEDEEHNHEEMRQRVAFVQDLIFSTIF